MDTYDEILEEVRPYAKKNGIYIVKPNRYRAGATSTLAIVENAFSVDKDGNIDLDKFISTLKALEKTIDEYCDAKKALTDKAN